MGRQMKGLLYFYFADVRYSLTIFWMILMSIVVVTLTITYFLNNIEGGFMTLSITGPMYVYCGILGFLTVKESIPFSIKRGATRKNIFFSLVIFFLSLSLVKSVIGSTLQVIVEFLNTKIRIENFHFIHLAYFTNDTWFHRILIDISIMFFAFSLMFAIGLLFYRYGLVGGGIFVGLLIITALTGAFQGWLIDFFTNIFKTFNNTFYLQLFGIGVVIYALSMLLLRRITIIKVR